MTHLSGFNDNINYCEVIKLEIYIKDKNMTCQGKVFMILDHKPYNNWFSPPLRSGENAAVEQRTPDFPSAPLRGEPGVRDRCPSGTAQLPH